MEQYRLLAECLLPARMLDWFDLKTVRVEKKGDTQVIHLYLDENEQKPDDGEDLRPNGFTRESVFHDFRLEVMKYCFTCAVADGLMQMVTT